MIREAGIDYTSLPETPPDRPFGFVTGAGVIFGVTGGVSEAVLRLAHERLTDTELKNAAFTEVRGYSGMRSWELELDQGTLRLGVVHGLATKAIWTIASWQGLFRFGRSDGLSCGCIGAGSAHTNVNGQVRQERGAGLYQDEVVTLFTSHSKQGYQHLCGLA